MSKELRVEIISPEGYIFNDQCHMAVIPSVEGDIGIQSNHESVLANLRKGKISIYDNKNKITKEFDIDGGFAEILENKLLALVDG